MALRNLRMFGDELLRKKSKPVKTINNNVTQLLDDMLETMRAHDGVGLAAPQVGVLKRIIVIEAGEQLIELINPEMIESDGTQNKSEGCLSFPGKAGAVERPERVKVKGLNRNGKEITVEGTELLAVVLCHEMDHLDGVLYTDKASEVHDLTAEDAEESEDEEDEES